MFSKLFSKVFFEKKKILVVFILFFTVFLFFVDFQLVNYDVQRNNSKADPDIIMSGQLDVDGGYRYKMYNSIGDANNYIQKEFRDAKSVPVVCRNIATMEYDQKLYNVSYQVLGLPTEFINDELKQFLIEGRLPGINKNEIILGEYAADYFEISVGDKLDFGLTLYEELAEQEGIYTVSGIISSTAEFYSTNVIMDYDSFCKQNDANVDYNMEFMYFKSDKADKTIELINKDRNKLNDLGVDTITSNYDKKNADYLSLIISNIGGVLIAITLLIVLMMYLIRGLSKKIGTLKAWGIRNYVINISFIGGLSLLTICSSILAFTITKITFMVINTTISKQMGYVMSTYYVNISILFKSFIIVLFIIAILFIVISFLCNRISPKTAMAKE